MLAAASRGDDLEPRNIEIDKTWRGVTRPKRRFLENGDSVPWCVADMERPYEPPPERWLPTTDTWS